LEVVSLPKENEQSINLVLEAIFLAKENEQSINLILEVVFLAKEECDPKMFVPSRRKDVAI
jgi:hypothetical protein